MSYFNRIHLAVFSYQYSVHSLLWSTFLFYARFPPQGGDLKENGLSLRTLHVCVQGHLWNGVKVKPSTCCDTCLFQRTFHMYKMLRVLYVSFLYFFFFRINKAMHWNAVQHKIHSGCNSFRAFNTQSRTLDEWDFTMGWAFQHSVTEMQIKQLTDFLGCFLLLTSSMLIWNISQHIE